jgi:glucose/arabinose dehydrogenase
MLGIAPSALAAPSAPPNFGVEPAVTGLVAPVAVAWAPDGRMFIAEKSGVVKVNRGGVTSQVIDLSDRVNGSGERGMLGIAVDRDFASNGHVYVLYLAEADPAAPDGDGETVSRLSRITVNPDNTVQDSGPGQDPLTHVVGAWTPPAGDPLTCPDPPPADLDCIPAPIIFHAIGTVRVDPADGTLWVGSGDSAAVYTRPYDVNSFAGKILHVGTDGRGLPGHPFCPLETDRTKACTKVYAKGLRNPFRFTLRGGGKGPVVGDVGARKVDEIDLIEPGVDYGWPCYEGSLRSPFEIRQECIDQYALEGTSEEPTGPSLESPLDPQTGGALIGGPLLDTPNYPAAYRGRVYFGDWARGWLRSAPVDGNHFTAPAEDFVTDAGFPVDIQVGPDGNLTYVDIAAGTVYRITYHAPDPAPDNPQQGDGPGSGDNPGASLPGERGGPAPNPTPTALRPLQLGVSGGRIRVRRDWSVRLKATNPNGEAWTGSATLSRRVGLASHRFAVPPGAQGAVVLKLNATGRKALRRRRRLAVIVSFKPRDGQAARRRVVLLAPRG